MINYTNRKQYIDKLLSYKDKDLIKVVSGLRRSGKSTLLDIYREQLLKMGIGKRQIQFYNFELPENYLLDEADAARLRAVAKVDQVVAN